MAVPEQVASREDLSACRALLRHGSRSFFAASRLLPRRVRDAATALYSFCRVADDAVDGDGVTADALAGLQQRLDRAYAGTPLAQPVDRAFAAVVHGFAIPRVVPEALLEGFEWDLAGRRYEDISGVYAYSARVAGTVGVMMSALMGVRSATLVARACDLGVAMQLTNIARDVGEDARAGRLYLPQRWMREAGLDPRRWLAAPRFTPALGAVVRRLLETADGLYRRADAGIGALPAACRPGIFAARLIYAEIGRQIAQRDFDSVSSRAVVSTSRKVALIQQAGLRSVLPRAAAGGPCLEESSFLVEAISRAEAPACRPRSMDERIHAVLDLFERLQDSADADPRRGIEVPLAVAADVRLVR